MIQQDIALYFFRAYVVDQIMSGSANSMPGTFDASPGDVEAENARLRRLVAVQRYMEGSIVHPGFLLLIQRRANGPKSFACVLVLSTLNTGAFI